VNTKVAELGEHCAHFDSGSVGAHVTPPDIFVTIR
jgi:hypothetical protein